MTTEEEAPHAFHPPNGPYASRARGPCPALNALSNHGYLPRDGHNISATDFIAPLENPDTYNLSKKLAAVLTYGGLALLRKLPWQTISLYDLARHNRIEHDASIVHGNTPLVEKFAPIRAETLLLEKLLEDKEFLTLDDVAKRRALLEKDSKLDPVHAEIARGEWALVLDIFGRSHGGNVPTDFIRVWLKENRFPEGWKPTHEQGLAETVAKSSAIRERMNEYKQDDELAGDNVEVQVFAEDEKMSEEVEKGKAAS